MPAPPFRDNNAYGLTNEDLLFLKRLARDYRHNPIGGQGNVRLGQPTEMNSPYLHGSFATDHYVVQVIDGYVPAAFQVPPLEAGDVWRVIPGVGFGQVYSFVQSATGTADGQANGAYVPVFGFVLIVDNLDTVSIPENTFCEVTKDKYGRWVIRSVLSTPSPITGTGTGTGTGPKPYKCTGCGWVAGLIASDCLWVFLDDVDTDTILSSVTGGSNWDENTQPITICGKQYLLAFTPTTPSPSLEITEYHATGTGSHYPVHQGHLDCCLCNYAAFTFSKALLCPDTERDPRGPCYDTVKIAVEWGPCTKDITICNCKVPSKLCLNLTSTPSYQSVLGCLGFNPESCRTQVTLTYDPTLSFGGVVGWWISDGLCWLAPGGSCELNAVALFTCYGHDWMLVIVDQQNMIDVFAFGSGGSSTFCPKPFTLDFTLTIPSSGDRPFGVFPANNATLDGSTWTITPWNVTCGSNPVTACCPSDAVPVTLHATCSDGRTATLEYTGDRWNGLDPAFIVVLTCSGGIWNLYDGSTIVTQPGSSLVCSPFSCHFVFSGFTWTVTA